MPENKTSSEETGQTTCSSCGTPIAPEDVSEGRAREADGKILCASCLDLQSKTNAVECKACGHSEPPLFDGKHHLCRNCGAVLTAQKRSAGGKAPGPRTPVQLCPYCNAAVSPGARLCTSCGARLIGSMRPTAPSGMRDYLIGAGVTAAIFVVALFVSFLTAARQQPQPQPVAQGVVSETDLTEFENKIMRTVELNLSSHKQGLKTYSEELKDAAAQAIALKTASLDQRLETLEKQMAAAPEERNQALAELLEGIRRLEEKATTTKAGNAAEKGQGETVRMVIRDTPITRETIQKPPAPEVGKARDDKAERDRQAVAELKRRAQELANQDKFSEALATLELRPDVRDPTWQATREKTKQAIRDQAEELFRLDRAQAEKMARDGRHEEAGQAYRLIMEYGLPDMVEHAEKRLVELAAIPEKVPEPVEEPQEIATPPAEEVAPLEHVDPRVRGYLTQLSDKEAAKHVRTRAAKELGLLRARAAVEGLANAMEDRDWYLRVCAAISLEQIGDRRAVPALIRNLDHPMMPVSETAKKALITITKEDFGKDAEKWKKWWETTGVQELSEVDRKELDRPEDGEVIEVAPEPGAFPSQVVIFKPDDRSVTFTITANSGLTIGQKIGLTRDGKKVASAEVTLIGFGTATAKIVEASADVAFEAGDMMIVER